MDELLEELETVFDIIVGYLELRVPHLREGGLNHRKYRISRRGNNGSSKHCRCARRARS